MDGLIKRIFLDDWKRKLVALIGAIAVWLFVHQSIIETKTLPNVPIRLVNLPADKTAKGLLPNGLLSKRLTLTLTGTKDVIDNLEPSDLEVVVDASSMPDEWILQISKKNLVSLDPSVDLTHDISTVTNNEFLIKLSRVITAKIPVQIAAPIGTAPEGYQFLDITPQSLWHSVTGPEESIRQLQEKGFELSFDLSQITKAQLEKLKGSTATLRQDEVAFPVPDKWKVITIPLDGETHETINDPAAKDLVINFLRQELIPITTEIPIRVFYPMDYATTINPLTHSLAPGPILKELDGIKLLAVPVSAGGVSRLFLDVVKDNIEMAIVAAPPQEREFLQTSIEFINQRELEDTFVSLMMADRSGAENHQKREARLRRRFREYMQELTMYKEKEQPLLLEAKLQPTSISLKDVSGTP